MPGRKKKFMIKRQFLIPLLIIIIVNTAHSQELYHSGGISGSIMRATLKGPLGKSGRFGMTHLHLNYYPRVSFPVNYFTTISAGIMFGIGGGFINNDFLSVKGNYLSYDIPLIIDYNVGYKASEPGDDHIGFYFGMGGGYTATQRDTLGVTKFKANSFGILARAGIRLDLEIPEKNTGISIGFFHKIGMGEEKFKTSGINLLVDF